MTGVFREFRTDRRKGVEAVSGISETRFGR